MVPTAKNMTVNVNLCVPEGLTEEEVRNFIRWSLYHTAYDGDRPEPIPLYLVEVP